MAIDSSIPLRVQVANVGEAISTGRQASMRERLMQAEIQQAKQNQAMQGVVNYSNLVDGLANVPLVERSKILAQNIPLLRESGIPTDKLTSMDLSDAGLSNVKQSLKPFMAKMQTQSSVPAAIETFKFHQSVLNDPKASEEQKRASRIALKLEGPAKTFTPKTVDIGGAKYLQVGNEFFHPQTNEPIPTDASGMPIGAPAGAKPVDVQTLTPEAQQQQIAEGEAAKVKAKEIAKAEVSEAGEVENQMDQANQTISVVDSILNSDRLDNITGFHGGLPLSLPATQDLLGEVQQLKSLLTAGNLGIMTGVLSESDMKIIQGLSNDIIIEQDEDGNVTRIKGSEAGTRKKLKAIRNKMVESMNKNGLYVEGQKAKGPDGTIIIYRNGEWVAQ